MRLGTLCFPRIGKVDITVFLVDGGQGVHDLHGLHRYCHQLTDEVFNLHGIRIPPAEPCHDLSSPDIDNVGHARDECTVIVRDGLPKTMHKGSLSRLPFYHPFL